MENGEQITEQQKSVETPEENYSKMLGQYVSYNDRIRKLEARGIHTVTQRDRLQEERHNLHGKLNQLGTGLGKTEDDIITDLMLEEGNLIEYGVKAPLIQLPLVTVSFEYDSDQGKVKLMKDKYYTDQKPTQTLYNSEGVFLASLDRPSVNALVGLGGKKIPYQESISGKEDEITKWNTGRYFAIIFAEERYGGDPHWPQIEHRTPLYETLLDRRDNLSKQFDLNRFSANNAQYHAARNLHGVEIPAEAIEKIAFAMKENPEKYWLTQEELLHPERFLEADKQLGRQRYEREQKEIKERGEEALKKYTTPKKQEE